MRNGGEGLRIGGRSVCWLISSLDHLAHADRFMTLDPKRYERDLPELKLL
jgi:hypothetical protein